MQFSTIAQSCPTLCYPMDYSMPGFPIHHQLLELTLKLMSIESMTPSSHLILCHPLLLLPSIFPSIRVFSSESALRIRWPKYWSFNFRISPSNECSGLISFRIDRFDFLVVQVTLKSLLQHHKSNSNLKEKFKEETKGKKRNYLHPHGLYEADLESHDSKTPLLSLLVFLFQVVVFWLKAQHSENEDHDIQSHHFMGNRWGNSGNSVRLYFSGLPNHCRG